MERLSGTEDRGAIIVVDLVHDFVDGIFKTERSLEVARNTEKFLEKVSKKLNVILTRDAHIEDDPEFKIWGPHCIDGTPGAELYGNLAKFSDRIISKRHYDAFFDSDLDGYLRARKISRVYICGISTDICVEHTLCGAFFRGYEVNIISDLCASLDIRAHEDAVKRMKVLYGARELSYKELEDIYVEK